jgi:hypothetical protein
LNPKGISLTVSYGDLERRMSYVRRFELRRKNNFAIVQRYNDEEKL